MPSDNAVELLRSNSTWGPRAPESGPPLPVVVVATTERGTRAALAAARRLGVCLSPQISLLVARVVPHLQPLEPPAGAVRCIEEWYRRLAEDCEVEATVRVCTCRPDRTDLAQAIGAEAIVLVGGRCRAWWPTRAQRLAARLSAAGRRVLFIDATRGTQRDLFRAGEATLRQGILEGAQALFARRRGRPLLPQGKRQ